MPTNEQIVDRLLVALAKSGAFADVLPIPWNQFGLIARAIHERFEVPGTSLTPIMRRLLFGVGYMSRGREVVGIGSYVGYPLAFLACGAACRAPTVRVTGIDPDRTANEVARRNLAALTDIGDVVVIDGESPEDLAAIPGTPDLVLLDLDNPNTGKRGYLDTLLALVGRLPPGAIISAHDACVPQFSEDIRSYHSAIGRHPRFQGPWTLPVDDCGLSLARVS